jgi:hypothetical protein
MRTGGTGGALLTLGEPENSSLEAKLPRECFLEICHWHISPQHTTGVSGSSLHSSTKQKTLKREFLVWRAVCIVVVTEIKLVHQDLTNSIPVFATNHTVN